MALQGTLDSFALPEVLKLLSSTRKSGRLIVNGARGSGSLWMDGGDLVASEASGVAAETSHTDVVFELLRYKEGSFIFENDATPTSKAVPANVAPVLADAERQIAEWEEIEAVVPSLDSIVRLSPELAEPVVTINAEVWRSLATIGSGCTVGQLGRSLDLGEIPVSRTVKSLVEAQLASVEPVEASHKASLSVVEAADEEFDDHADDHADEHGASATFDEVADHADEDLLDDDGPSELDEPDLLLDADEPAAEDDPRYDDESEHQSFDLAAADAIAGMGDDTVGSDQHEPISLDTPARSLGIDGLPDEPWATAFSGPPAAPDGSSFEPPPFRPGGSDEPVARPSGLSFEPSESEDTVLVEDPDPEAEEMARQLAKLSPKAARAVAAAARANTQEERDAALQTVDEESDEPVNRDLLLKFLGSVGS